MNQNFAKETVGHHNNSVRQNYNDQPNQTSHLNMNYNNYNQSMGMQMQTNSVNHPNAGYSFNDQSVYLSNTSVTENRTPNIPQHSAVLESPKRKPKPTEQTKVLSDYEKGLQKLAELMDDDVELKHEDMEKMKNNYDLNKK